MPGRLRAFLGVQTMVFAPRELELELGQRHREPHDPYSDLLWIPEGVPPARMPLEPKPEPLGPPTSQHFSLAQ
jgi:hypothetical protein